MADAESENKSNPWKIVGIVFIALFSVALIGLVIAIISAIRCKPAIRPWVRTIKKQFGDIRDNFDKNEKMAEELSNTLNQGLGEYTKFQNVRSIQNPAPGLQQNVKPNQIVPL